MARCLTAVVLDVLLLFVFGKVLSGAVLVLALVVLFAANALAFKIAADTASLPLPQVPEHALLPTEGLPRYIYWVKKLYGFPDRVPKLTANQQLEEETKLLEKRLRDLGELVQPTIWVGNQKGNAAKTMVSVVGGDILSEVLRRTVVLLPTSANTTTGTAGKLTGLRGKTITTRQYYRLIADRKLPDVRELGKVLHNTRAGLFVVRESEAKDDLEDKAMDGYFSPSRFDVIFRHARRNAHVVVLDTGNDGADTKSVTTAALKKAHVLIVSACIEAPQTLDMAGETLADYTRFDQINGDENILIGDLIANAVVVFNGLQPDENVENYRHHVSLGNGSPFMGPIVSIQHDDYLKRATANVDYRMMEKRTFRDFLVLYIAAFEQAALLQGIELPARHPAIASQTRFISTPHTA